MRSCVSTYVWPALLVLAGLTLGGVLQPAEAQAPLRLVNGETTVSEISFRFVDHQTFETERLHQQIVTTAPGLVNRIRARLDFLPGIRARVFPFDPVTLQKDVVRLRRFYNQNGFLDPEIDYPASQLDTTDNRIHVIFTIHEGPALSIQSADFRTADGAASAEEAFRPQLRENWSRFRREQTSFRIGERYTQFKRTQIEDNVGSWLRSQGFAFANVSSEAQIDSTEHTADLRFFIDPGPRGVVSEIQIEGNESVDKSIVLRELPFSVGDRFSATDVKDGQQRLFDLNLFRVALADVPDQPRDSTVTVRYRVREAHLRSISGQVGYGTQPGVTLEGSWRHRNFFGDARTFIAGLTAETGKPENPPSFLPGFLVPNTQETSRRFRASVTLRQPYLFSSRLSGSLAPFLQERLNPALAPNPNRTLSLNERQFGVNSTLVYDLLPFRTLSLEHSFSRTRQFLTTTQRDTTDVGALLTEDDLFNKSVFALSGTFGNADDYISPTRGYLFRPNVQLGGFFFESGIEFVRLNTEVSGYLPLSDDVSLAGRLFAGTLWPFNESHAALTPPSNPSEDALRRNRIYQNRFSDYLFYAGGSSDVRGWASQLAGGKALRRSPVIRGGYVYQPIGTRSKLGVNLEARFDTPGLGSDWRTAAFVDAAFLTPGTLNLIPPVQSSAIVEGPDGNAVTSDPSQYLVGTGLGLRYQTPFGFLRMDLAYKLTPDRLDLHRPQDVGTALDAGRPVRAASTRFLRRFRLHFGIGRSF